MVIIKDRVKKIEITDGENVLGIASFNPHDMNICKKFAEMCKNATLNGRDLDNVINELDCVDNKYMLS